MVKWLARTKRLILVAVMPLFFRVLASLTKEDPRLVVFSAFNGLGYLDNPRAIFEAMQQDPDFEGYHFVWAMPVKSQIPGSTVVKVKSLSYFYYLVKAKYWVFNAKMPFYYRKRPGQIYLQTWHGTPLKRLAHDIVDNGQTYYRSQQTYAQMVKSYDDDSHKWDYLISANQFSTDVFKTAFRFPESQMLEMGYPRNDILTRAKEVDIAALKEAMGLPLDKKVILYAPTWRDNLYGLKGFSFELQVDFEAWYDQLGQDYVILFKPHYLIAHQTNLSADLAGFVYSVPQGVDIAELYLVSDILVTDYSSVFFDYANLRRPIYFYMYDFEFYQDVLRGFYLAVPEDLPNEIHQDERQLLAAIKADNFDYKRLLRFNMRFNSWQFGNSAQKVIEEVFK